MFVSPRFIAKAKSLGLLDQTGALATNTPAPKRQALPWEDPNHLGYLKVKEGEVVYFRRGRTPYQGEVKSIIPAGDSAENHRPEGVPKSRFKYTTAMGKNGKIESFRNTRRALIEVEGKGKQPEYHVVTLLENHRFSTGFMVLPSPEKGGEDDGESRVAL
ncbi:hypothetical protein [Tumebacillus lipolyticus]|uniref:HNH endonuclease n=1 Tax=Tumebacillus lipolyticus TaxID=1280370 RepID=A0ABW5A4G1_9BACL